MNPQDKAALQNRALLSLGAGLLQAGAPRVGAPGPGIGAALAQTLESTDRYKSGLLSRNMAQQTQEMNAAKLASMQADAERRAKTDATFLGDGQSSPGLLSDPRQRALYQADPAAFVKAQMNPSTQKPIFQKRALPGGKVQEVVSYDNGRSFQPFGAEYNRRDPYLKSTAVGPNGEQKTTVLPRADLDAMFKAQQPGANGVRSVSIGSKAPTQDQLKAATYADRLSQANNVLDALDGEGASLRGHFLARAPLGNYAQSAEYQQYEQAKRSFVNATLRRDSGAVIADSEFRNAEREYFPVPGDSEKVIEQKRRNRAREMRSMVRSAGGAYSMGDAPTQASQPKRLRWNPATQSFSPKQ